jgi:hypothetical protein
LAIPFYTVILSTTSGKPTNREGQKVMKFGIYSSIANPPRGEDLPRCVDEVIEEAQLAEQAGFDSCFFGEHHQDKDGFLPSPLIVCTAVAAATTTLRVDQQPCQKG